MTTTVRATTKPRRPTDDRPVRRPPAGALHAALGAELALDGGWEVPRSYGDVRRERAFIADDVAIVDITPRAKIDVRGRLDAALPAVGGPEVAARLAPRWALLLGPPGGSEERVSELQGRAGTAAMVTDATHLYAGYALCGPRLPELLARVTSWDPSTLAVGEAAAAPIVEIPAVLVRRDLGVPLIEVFVGSEFGRYAWRSLLGAVRSLGGGPAGWEALLAEGWS